MERNMVELGEETIREAAQVLTEFRHQNRTSTPYYEDDCVASCPRFWDVFNTSFGFTNPGDRHGAKNRPRKQRISWQPFMADLAGAPRELHPCPSLPEPGRGELVEILEIGDPWKPPEPSASDPSSEKVTSDFTSNLLPTVETGTLLEVIGRSPGSYHSHAAQNPAPVTVHDTVQLQPDLRRRKNLNTSEEIHGLSVGNYLHVLNASPVASFLPSDHDHDDDHDGDSSSPMPFDPSDPRPAHFPIRSYNSSNAENRTIGRFLDVQCLSPPTHPESDWPKFHPVSSIDSGARPIDSPEVEQFLDASRVPTPPAFSPVLDIVRHSPSCHTPNCQLPSLAVIAPDLSSDDFAKAKCVERVQFSGRNLQVVDRPAYEPILPVIECSSGSDPVNEQRVQYPTQKTGQKVLENELEPSKNPRDEPRLVSPLDVLCSAAEAMTADDDMCSFDDVICSQNDHDSAHDHHKNVGTRKKTDFTINRILSTDHIWDHAAYTFSGPAPEILDSEEDYVLPAGISGNYDLALIGKGRSMDFDCVNELESFAVADKLQQIFESGPHIHLKSLNISSLLQPGDLKPPRSHLSSFLKKARGVFVKSTHGLTKTPRSKRPAPSNWQSGSRKRRKMDMELPKDQNSRNVDKVLVREQPCVEMISDLEFSIMFNQLILGNSGDSSLDPAETDTSATEKRNRDCSRNVCWFFNPNSSARNESPAPSRSFLPDCIQNDWNVLKTVSCG